MPRKLKPHQVGEYRHPKYDIVVPILLDREQKTFFATFGAERFEKKSYDDVYRAVREHLATAFDIQWKPMLAVESNVTGVGNFRGYEAEVGLTVQRFWVADKPKTNGKHRCDKLELAWDRLDEHGHERPKDPEDRFYRPAIEVARDHREYPHIAELPYSEEKWRALCAIRERIEQAREQLRALLHAKDLGGLLEDIARRLPAALPPAAEPAGALPAATDAEQGEHIVRFTIADDPETLAMLAAMGALKVEGE